MTATIGTARVASLWGEAAITDRNDYRAWRDMLQSMADAFTSSDGRPYRVTFSKATAIARTDPRERLIEANPDPINDASLTLPEVWGVMTAYLAHETTHDRYWRNYGKVLDAAFGSQGPLRERAHLYDNLLQDIYGERRFEVDYPGFVGLFAPMAEYVATRFPNPRPMRDCSVPDVAICATRYAAWRDWTGAEAERAWWQDWANRATAKPSPSRWVAAIREALDHERFVSGKGKPQGSDAGQDGNGGKGGKRGGGDAKSGKPEPAQDGAQGDGDGDGAAEPGAASQDGSGDPSASQGDGQGEGESGPDGAPAQGHGTGHDTWDGLTQPATEQACTSDQLDAAPSYTNREAIEARATLDAEYIARPDHSQWPTTPIEPDGAIVAAVAAAFRRSRTGTTGYERGHRSGLLDDRSLARMAEGNYSVFGRRIAPDPGRYSVYVMLDVSPSMQWSRGRVVTPVQEAQDVAASLAHAARSLPGLRLSLNVWASGPVVHVWETGEPLSWVNGVTRTSAGGGTDDASAMRWAVEHIRKTLRPGEQPIIIMLSDGEGDREGLEAAVAEGGRKGIRIVGVSIGKDLDMSAIYGREWVPWQGSVSAVAQPLATIIGRAMNPTEAR